MSIKYFSQKIKLFWANIKDKAYSQDKGLKIKGDLFIVILMILLGTASFGLGKLSAYETKKTPISLSHDNTLKNTVSENNLSQKGIIFSSKTGTKYYYPTCSGASRIKEENRVWFNSVSDAESVGLTLAVGCNK